MILKIIVLVLLFLFAINLAKASSLVPVVPPVPIVKKYVKTLRRHVNTDFN